MEPLTLEQQKALALAQARARAAQASPPEDVPELTITAPKKEKLSWGDVAARAISNAPESAINFGQSIVQPILHPIETAKGLAAVGGGVIQHALNVLPERVTSKLPKMDTAAADAVGKYFVDRYGSEDGLKQALAEDPVGVASDVALLLTGGGAALKGLSTTAKLGEVASAAGRAVDPMTHVVNAARKGVNALGDVLPAPISGAPGVKAAQKLALKAGVTADQLAAADPSLTAAEAVGAKGSRTVQTLARREGDTGEKFAALAESRKLGRADAMLEDFSKATGVSPQEAAGNVEAIVKKGREDAEPLYKAAIAKGPLMTPELQKLLERPAVGAAVKHAADIAANEGKNLSELGFEISGGVAKEGLPALPKSSQDYLNNIEDPARRMSIEASIRKELDLDKPVGNVDTSGYSAIGGPKVVGIKALTSEGWDLIKRGLDEELKAYRDPLTKKLDVSGRGGAIVKTINDLRKAITDANPSYKEALEKAGDYKAVEDAFNRGGKLLFDNRVDESAFAKSIKDMGETELQGLKAGVAKKLYDLAQNDKLDPKLFKAPRVKQKLETLLGPEAAAQLEESALRHAAMQKFESMPTGRNSLREAIHEQDALIAPGAQMTSDFVKGGVMHTARGIASKAVTHAQDLASKPFIKQRNALGDTLLGSPQALADELRMTEGKKLKRKASLDALARKYMPKGKTPPLVQGLTVVRDRTTSEE